MQNILSLLTLTTVLAAGSIAHAADSYSNTTADIKKTANGGYESIVKTESQNTAGTTKASESVVDVDVQNDGRINRTVSDYTISDPQGLMNKRSRDTQTEFSEKVNGGYKQVTTSTYKDAAGTDVKMVTTTDVDIDNKGNVMTTAKTEKTVNPKGFMNETTSTSKTRSVNGQIIEKTKKIN